MSIYPVVVMPDAVYVLGAFLQSELPDYGWTVPVRDRVPETRPSRLVVVRRVGGVRRNEVTDEPMVTVEAWAPTHQEAQDLCALSRALIHALPGTVQSSVPVYRVTDVAGPQLLPDPLSNHPRYSCTLTVAMRGATVEPSSA
jgi:hypothetical protein